MNESPLFRRLKDYTYPQLAMLAEEIRETITSVVATNTGHLASNLGTVELTLALYRVFDPDRDIIIWDTGHQAYTHKLLTGRYGSFRSLRKKGGLSGFLKVSESPYDRFGAGHVGTALPAALGMEKSDELFKISRNIIVVAGDGAITSGMALEALNQMKDLGSKIKVIMNDNGMSIGKNVGSLSSAMAEMRLNPFYREIKGDLKNTLETMKLGGLEQLLSKIKSGLKATILGGNVFEDMGLNYIGPVGGHDIQEMETLFNAVKEIDEPFFVHVVTKKGKGLEYAEKNPARFHSVGKIDPESGEKTFDSVEVSYSDVFGRTLTELASLDPSIVAITAAMPDGTGLSGFMEKFPARFYDLGITEQLCTTFAAGMAVSHSKPVFAVYSTFLQRAFDQLAHDVALQDLPVLFAVDRAGIVGQDGPTHNGIFDIAFLSMLPNMRVLSPSSVQELSNMLYTLLLKGMEHPTAIRYPREAEVISLDEVLSSMKEIALWKWEEIMHGEEGAILATGSMVSRSYEVALNYGYALYNCRSIKPLDESMLEYVFGKYDTIVCVEEGIKRGGFGSGIALKAIEHGYAGKIDLVAIDDCFSPHGTRDEILSELGLDTRGIEKTISRLRGEKNASDYGIR
ncbi:MAG TPA: 1-deoxy-D-xylulose-5-phosphate synthase [Mesotoga sp.]|nr:1-deoxy-D-xylulose-5-phosphate synthase [Mesotoga sp.]MDD5743541.1 1-deoxy-D-xylulose-5-phosphate synthase [Mesotoga sp.]HPI17253.1 1-deoxy-D-xylulose-5-phosphate synthase [Mesotoga sp.]HPM94366.1 1-deoxy-D-xylulose-5-phosphate synthase [Mesotoga sp.]